MLFLLLYLKSIPPSVLSWSLLSWSTYTSIHSIFTSYNTYIHVHICMHTDVCISTQISIYKQSRKKKIQNPEQPIKQPEQRMWQTVWNPEYLLIFLKWKKKKKAYFPGIHPPQGVRGESTLGMPFKAIERLGFSKFSNMMSDVSTHLGYI